MCEIFNININFSPFSRVISSAICDITAVASNREIFIICVCMTRTFAVDFWQMEDGLDREQHVLPARAYLRVRK